MGPDNEKFIDLLGKVDDNIGNMERVIDSEEDPLQMANASKKVTVRRGPNLDNWDEESDWVPQWGVYVETEIDYTYFTGIVKYYSNGLHLSWVTGTDKRGNCWDLTIPGKIIGQWVAGRLKQDKDEE